MKVVWYINHYAGGPGISRAYRPFMLSKFWVKKGFRSVVVASGYHHLFYHDDLLTGYKNIEGVEYHFLNNIRYTGNGLGRIANMAIFSLSLLVCKLNCRKQDRPDVIIYSSPHLFGYLPARFLAWRYGAKFILEVRDIWPASLVEIAGASPLHPFVLLNSFLERMAYSLSKNIVGLPSAFSRYIEERGISGKQVVEIGNGFEIDDICDRFKNRSPLLDKLRKLRSQGKVIAVYAGGHGVPNALTQFIEAASLLNSNSSTSLCFVFLGDGSEKEKLQSYAKEKSLRNVYFFGYVDKDQLFAAYRLADIAFLGWLDKPIYKYGISPNKLAEYMGSGLPVVHATCAANDPVSESNCGVSVSPGNVTAISDAFLELERAGGDLRRIMGGRGKVFVEDHFSYKTLADKYIQLFLGRR